MAETVVAEFASDKRTSRCSLHQCQSKIKTGETYFRITVWMGGCTKKYVRICKKCLVVQTQNMLTAHPEFKQEMLENYFGGN
jgi:hypothetical protein